MSFAPIAHTIPEYDRTLYANWWLKAYEQGTTTPLNMATDATGGTTLVKCELDTQGFPITAGSARFIPFIDGSYDLWLFPTEAEADANDTTNAIQFADNLNADPATGSQMGAWDNTVTYSIPEIVLGSNDDYYRSLIDSNTGNDPVGSPVQWEQLEFGRIWNTNVTYSIGDSSYGSNGLLYVSLTNSNSGNNPTSDITNWGPGVKFTGIVDNATTTALTLDSSQNALIGSTTQVNSGLFNEKLLVDSDETDGTGGLVVSSFYPSITFWDKSSGGIQGSFRLSQDGGDFLIEHDSADDGTFESTPLTIDSSLTASFSTGVNVRATPVYGMVILDTPIEVATSTAITNVAKAEIDITAHTTGVAVKAILMVDSLVQTNTAALSGMDVWVGEPDETFSVVHRATYAQTYSSDTGLHLSNDSNTVTVNLKTGELFAWQITEAGTVSAHSTSIHLVGYYV